MDDITWVGLDVHKDSIAVAMSRAGRAMVEWQVSNDERSVRRLARKLTRAAEEGQVRCCYEAGPCGFVIGRQMEAASPSLVCEMVAPSMIPVRPGDRVKTDKRDARKLCELNRAGQLTMVYAPSVEQEAVRDLCRAREQERQDVTRARNRLTKWLLKRGLVYRQGRAWTKRHESWLGALEFERRSDRLVFANYLLAVRQGEQRLASLEAELEAVAEQDEYRGRVGRLRCFRGVDTITAMTVATEVFDIRRFATAPALMSYLGLTVSESSSGPRTRRGGITKTGNAHVRRVLVETAWHYRHAPAVGRGLRERRRGQPAQIVALADKAQHRLSRRYRRMTERGVPSPKAVVAVARELAGFLWAVLVAEEQRS